MTYHERLGSLLVVNVNFMQMSPHSVYPVLRHCHVVHYIVQVCLDGRPGDFHHGGVPADALDVIRVVISDLGIHDLFGVVFRECGQGLLVASVYIEDGFPP